MTAWYRRTLSNNDFFVDCYGGHARTAGRVVVITMLMSFSLYGSLLVNLFQIT